MEDNTKKNDIVNDIDIINDMIDPRYKLKCTCVMCPEQYDVIDTKTNESCGYIRLRWGELTCEYPDCSGIILYSHTFQHECGCFRDTKERILHLTACVELIKCANEI